MLRDDSAVISMHMRREAADALDAMESALRETANIARQYDSEYAGRTEVYCTGCDERLTDSASHEVGCPWAVIDAALAKLEGK